VTDFVELLEAQLVDAHARRRPARLPSRRTSGALVFAVAAAAAIVVAIVALASPRAAREPAAPSAPAVAPPVTPSKSAVVVSVLNATREPAVARVEAIRLARAGYRIGTVANAPGPRRERSVVYYARAGLTEALLLARRERIARVDAAGPTIRGAAGRVAVIVVLGADHPR